MDRPPPRIFGGPPPSSPRSSPIVWGSVHVHPLINTPMMLVYNIKSLTL